MSDKTTNQYGIKGGLPAATKIAVDNFNHLTDEQFARLKSLERYLRWHRISHKPINKKILPLFYDLGLFVYDESIVFFKIENRQIRIIWSEGIAWLMTLDAKSKGYQPPEPDLATTLQLLTSVLQGSALYGADYWYSKGITQKLISHLIQLRQTAK